MPAWGTLPTIMFVDPPPPPSREQVADVLRALIDGEQDRSSASSWALQWVFAADPRVDDEKVWKALGAIAGADTPTLDRPWLFNETDFRAWLADLEVDGRNVPGDIPAR